MGEADYRSNFHTSIVLKLERVLRKVGRKGSRGSVPGIFNHLWENFLKRSVRVFGGIVGGENKAIVYTWFKVAHTE